MAGERETRPVYAVAKAGVRLHGSNETADVIGAVDVIGVGPGIGLAERSGRPLQPSGLAAVAGGVCVVWGEDYVAGGGEGLHQEARLGRAPVKAVREDDHRLLGGRAREFSPDFDFHAGVYKR